MTHPLDMAAHDEPDDVDDGAHSARWIGVVLIILTLAFVTGAAFYAGAAWRGSQIVEAHHG